MLFVTMEKNAQSLNTSIRISSWISGMVILVFIMIAKQVTSKSGNNNNTLLRRYCRSYQSSNGESYLSNINTTFSSLRRQLSDPQVYYAFSQTTNNDEIAYAFAMCRDYLSTSQCLACFESAVKETKTCGIADGGNIIYDDCSISYGNFGVNFGTSKVILDDEAQPGAVCGNESASQPATTFNQVVENLLSDIRHTTPRTSNYYVASTRQVPADNTTVYAMAQCVTNVSQAICLGCLNTSYNNLHVCLPNKEGRAIDFFCFMRYSETPFFESNQVTNITHFLSEDMSLRDMLHLESFEDDDIEYTSLQQNPGDKPFLEMLKAPSFKIRDPEASASTEVGGSSSSVAVATTERDAGKLPEDVSASAVTEVMPKHRKKSSRKRKNDEGGSGEKVRGTPKRTKTPLDTITEISPRVQASPSTLLETLSDHLDGGKSARDEPHVDFDESSLRHPNPSPLHSHPPMTEPSSPDSMDLDPAVAEEKFVPNWDIKNGDKILDALTARTMMLNLNTPAEAHRYRRAAPLALADALMMNQAQSIGLVTEVYRRWVDLEIEKEKVISLVGGEDVGEWSKKLEALVGEKQSLEERLNQALVQVKSNSAAMALASEDRDKALKEVEGLKAERDAAVQEKKMFEVEASRFRSQLDQMKKEMDGQVSKLTESNSQLSGQVKELLETKGWLLTEGMRSVARRVHTGEELKAVVGAINNAMNACGVNVGVKAGYHYSGKGLPFEQVPKLKLNADEMLNEALDRFDTLDFPFLQHIARFASEPLDTLKTAAQSGDLFKPPSS